MVSDLPIVGLRGECKRIRLAIEQRRSLLVMGPPGSGKTKLLRSMICESGSRLVYLAAPAVLHDLLVELGKALIDRGHPPLECFVPSGEHPHSWLASQTSLHLRGILLSALETEPVMIALDHIRNAGAQTYRFLQKVYYTRGAAIIAVSRRSRELGYLNRLFWDPRDTVTFNLLGHRDSLQLFNMLAQKFKLDTFDLEDFRHRVLQAARGNPGEVTYMCELAANPGYQRGRHILFAPLRIDTITHFAP